MKSRYVICLVVLTAAITAVTCCRGCAEDGEVRTDTDTLYIRDTVRVPHPVVKVERTVRRDTVWLAKAGERDTVYVDSVRVVVPITQRTYKDSTYTAWVSGYRPRLDSIEVYRNEVRTVVTRQAPAKTARWGVGVSAGVAVTPRGAQPYVGVGVTFVALKLGRK